MKTINGISQNYYFVEIKNLNVQNFHLIIDDGWGGREKVKYIVNADGYKLQKLLQNWQKYVRIGNNYGLLCSTQEESGSLSVDR